MIKENMIYFGYGSIIVGYDINAITLSEITNPQEIGHNLKNDFEYLETVKIILTSEQSDRLLDELKSLKFKENKEINIENYILDFNKYNEKSVKVLIEAIVKSRYNLMAFAC